MHFGPFNRMATGCFLIVPWYRGDESESGRNTLLHRQARQVPFNVERDS
jgi:hypothetical protein